MKKKIKVVVTGAHGQLGRTLKDEAKDTEGIQWQFYNSKELDITNAKQVERVFKNQDIDYCINCAAYTAVDNAEKEKEIAFKINFEGVKNLAKICEICNTTLIHISTDFVFDGNNTKPYIEDDKVNPLNVYGKSKLKGEEQIIGILTKYYIIRTSWLYSEHNNNFLKTMLKLAKKHKEISVVSDQYGTPTYAKDLANMLLTIVTQNKRDYGVYHYSNKGITSWYGFAKEIFELSGIEIKVNAINTEGYPTPAIRPAYSVLDKNKIKKVFGVEAPNWRDSLKKCLIKINNFQQNI